MFNINVTLLYSQALRQKSNTSPLDNNVKNAVIGIPTVNLLYFCKHLYLRWVTNTSI